MQEIASLTILGFIQGLTEFLPISSTGHLIVAREFFNFGGVFGLAEDAVLHLATALAILVYFRKDIISIARGAFQATLERVFNKELKIMFAIIVGTIPAAIFGLLLENNIETVFRESIIVAVALVVGSLVFLAAEYAQNKIQEKREMTIGRGLIIGLFQALALIPGMSRSGMTISGGLFLGLSREDAARFGFLLSFPIIFGAGLLKLRELANLGALESIGVPLIFGASAAFLSGILAIHFLLSFVKTHTLIPFVIYRLFLAGLIFYTVLI